MTQTSQFINRRDSIYSKIDLSFGMDFWCTCDKYWEGFWDTFYNLFFITTTYLSCILLYNDFKHGKTDLSFGRALYIFSKK